MIRHRRSTSTSTSTDDDDDDGKKIARVEADVEKLLISWNM